MMLFLYALANFGGRQMKIAKMHRQELSIQQEIDNALGEQEKLKKEIGLLHTDDYVEAIARDELGLAKSGEIIYKYIKD